MIPEPFDALIRSQLGGSESTYHTLHCFALGGTTYQGVSAKQ